MCFLGGVLQLDLLAFLDIFLEVTSVLGLLDLDLELQDEDDDDELLEDEVLLLLRTLLTDPLLPHHGYNSWPNVSERPDTECK